MQLSSASSGATAKGCGLAPLPPASLPEAGGTAYSWRSLEPGPARSRSTYLPHTPLQVPPPEPLAERLAEGCAEAAGSLPCDAITRLGWAVAALQLRHERLLGAIAAAPGAARLSPEVRWVRAWPGGRCAARAARRAPASRCAASENGSACLRQGAAGRNGECQPVPVPTPTPVPYAAVERRCRACQSGRTPAPIPLPLPRCVPPPPYRATRSWPGR